MNLWALDKFLLLKLEAVMAKSVISPFAIARFCLTGSVLAAIGLTVEMTLILDRVGLIIWFIQTILSAGVFFNISTGERDNNCGYINRWKVDYPPSRTIILLVTVINLFNGIKSLTDVLATVYFTQILFTFYFMSINWTQPKRKESKLLKWMKFKHA